MSTDHEEQESSYEAQVDHFTKLIASHDDWVMVDIYADPGLSGKNTKRVQFKRMLKDCDDGKIDIIITKSVSRFARNTLDCVQTARKLKANGIGIIFEKENLDTLQERSEFVLTIMASLAEEESRSISLLESYAPYRAKILFVQSLWFWRKKNGERNKSRPSSAKEQQKG